MNLSFILKWSELIAGVFAEYPLAAGFVTLLAVGVYIVLWSQPREFSATNAISVLQDSMKGHFPREDHSVKNIFFVLLGWSIVVPILGLIFNLISDGFSFFLWLYLKYEQQPLWFISCLILFVVVFFTWGKFLPNPPGLLIRGSIVIICFLVFVAISVPLVNAIFGTQENDTPIPSSKAKLEATKAPN